MRASAVVKRHKHTFACFSLAEHPGDLGGLAIRLGHRSRHASRASHAGHHTVTNTIPKMVPLKSRTHRKDGIPGRSAAKETQGRWSQIHHRSKGGPMATIDSDEGNVHREAVQTSGLAQR